MENPKSRDRTARTYYQSCHVRAEASVHHVRIFCFCVLKIFFIDRDYREMSAILSADDLNDFISPGVACIKPVETLPLQNPQKSEVRLLTAFSPFRAD